MGKRIPSLSLCQRQSFHGSPWYNADGLRMCSVRRKSLGRRATLNEDGQARAETRLNFPESPNMSEPHPRVYIEHEGHLGRTCEAFPVLTSERVAGWRGHLEPDHHVSRQGRETVSGQNPTAWRLHPLKKRDCPFLFDPRFFDSVVTPCFEGGFVWCPKDATQQRRHLCLQARKGRRRQNGLTLCPTDQPHRGSLFPGNKHVRRPAMFRFLKHRIASLSEALQFLPVGASDRRSISAYTI